MRVWIIALFAVLAESFSPRLGLAASEVQTEPTGARHQIPKLAHRNGDVRIILDPGHGGKDLGAEGYLGLLEKDLVLRLARAIRADLETQGRLRGLPLQVRLTRDQDVFLSLRDRVRMANDWEADYFVSIHGNSSPVAKAKGFEVYFMSPDASDDHATKVASLENGIEPTRLISEGRAEIQADVHGILADAQSSLHVAESSRFAESLYLTLSRTLGFGQRGVKQAPFTVLSGTTMPSVLLEVGYLTHVEDAKLLSSPGYLRRLCNAISDGILGFVNRKRK